MPIIKCKMCGGDLNIVEDSSVCECEYCGTKQTVPRVDDEKKIKLFERANRLRSACEFDKAAGVYETILADFDQEAEAYWCLILCKFGIEYVDDPGTGKKIPTCHRSSFESLMDDPNFDMVMECADPIARRVYRDEAKAIEELRKGIIEVSSKEEPYDVFISYKELDDNGERTLDSVIAQDIYTELTEKGYRVFFSRISLESKLGVEYEPYIFAALNSAKVMLVVGTDYDYFNAVWVKNEWSRFLALIASGQKKTLIPVFKGIDAYDMPKEFNKLAAQDMGKVGAMQDLVRGVEKLLGKKDAPEAAQAQPVIVQGGGPNVTALLKRGQQALEDDDWARAKDFYEQVLSMDAENGGAFLGLALAEKQCRKPEDYFTRLDRLSSTNRGSDQATVARAGDHIRAQLESLAIPGYLEQEELAKLYDIQKTYPLTASRQKARNASALAELDADRSFARALRYSSDEAKQLRERLKSAFAEREKSAEEADRKAKQDAEAAYRAALEQADRTAVEKHRAASEKREADYRAACAAMDGADTEAKFQACIPRFKKLKGYKDSAERIEQCKKQSAVIQEAKEKAAAAEKRRRTRNTLIALLICAALAVGAYFGYTRVYVPMQQYKAAEALLAAEKYEEAAAAFGTLGTFRNSAARVEEAIERANARDYAAAEELLAAEKYEEAAATFGALGDYRDSAARVDEAIELANARDYAAAEALLAAEKYEEAAAAFRALGDYCDSAARLEEAIELPFARDYAAAEAMLAAEKYEEAAAAFRELGTFRDSAARVDEAIELANARDYAAAEALLAAEKYEEAAAAFRALGDYCDSAARLEEAIVLPFARDYAAAEALVAAEKYEEAATAFFALGSYRDAREQSFELWEKIAPREAVAAGGWHTVGLRADGTVVTEGYSGSSGRELGNWRDIVAVAAGDYHTVGLKSDGTVVAVGDNDSGQCEVGGWRDIVAVAAGYKHTVGLKADGTVVVKGSNSHGQCWTGGWRDIVAVAAGTFHTVGLKSDGTVVAEGDNDSGQCEVSGWSDIVAVAAGDKYTVGLKADGTVVAVGENFHGQCEVGGWYNIVAVAAGCDHTVGLRADGTVVATAFTGDQVRNDGQCEVGGWYNIVAIAAGSWHTVGLRADGTVVAVGDNGHGRCEVGGWTDIRVLNT